MLDVERFGLGGGTMKNLRCMVTKARKSEVRAEVIADADLTDEGRAAMRDLAEEIRSRRWFGEMGFSVGRLDDPADVERTVGLAYGADGRLVAYVTWLWLPGAATMVLDEVKRGPEAPSGTMEMLIATSLLEFKGRAQRASLGLAPITGRMSAGLHRFKAKFDPIWEPRYLVVERLADLPAVLLAMLLLHYPQPGLASALRGRLSARPAGPRTA
jgi:lysylphosphatidylglycerol synthetase-like protein (DUF2156 family)